MMGFLIADINNSNVILKYNIIIKYIKGAKEWERKRDNLLKKMTIFDRSLPACRNGPVPIIE